MIEVTEKSPCVSDRLKNFCTEKRLDTLKVTSDIDFVTVLSSFVLCGLGQLSILLFIVPRAIFIDEFQV